VISHTSFRADVPIVTLGDVVEFLDSKRKPITESERVSGPYPYYGANGIQDSVAEWIFDEELVLLAEDGGHFENPDRGVAYKISGKSWVNNHAHVLRPTNEVHIDYLKHVLKNMDLMPYITGSTRLKLNKSSAERIKIPLPPFAEQQLTAAILDKADEIMRKREQAIVKLDELAQSTFVEMFGDPLTNPMQLPTAKLEEITIKITDGEHLNPKFTEYGMPIVMAGNVLENDVELTLAKKVSTEDGHKFRKKCKPEKNDLLLVSRGATIGRMTIVKSSDEFCLMGSVILIKVNLSKVNPTYLTTLLKFPHMRSALYKTSGSSAQQAIYLKDLKNQTCLLPDIINQNKFGEKIKSINLARKLQIESLHQSCNLSSSLQHQVFTTGLNA